MANVKNRMQANLHNKFRMGKGQPKAEDPQRKHIHSAVTLRTYLREAARYADWLKAHGVKGRCTEDEAREHIQDYINEMVESGKSPNSIHTATAAVCKALDVSLRDYDRPRRTTAPKKGRTAAPSLDGRGDSCEANPRYVRLVEFARRVGIRRAEYAELRGRDFETIGKDSFVVVRQGKGGKRQFQRIDPADVEFVRKYFAGVGADELVFRPDELRNKINLHALRRRHAQEMYAQYAARLQEDPNYRNQLTEELRQAFERAGENWRRNRDMQRCASSPWYFVRGGVRRNMQANGRDVRYDRLALMAVSVFHLAHWRCDVTVANYMR